MNGVDQRLTPVQPARATRASASLATTTEVAHGGSRSLAVTDRSASWDGPAVSWHDVLA
ncbi:carbohydrate binding domain-containing protein [Sphaerimonospora thailandensis]|uniref:hypothetical protein n=1 Tax=Sphaerimonospora thailandensis TaxID=795644 RepID=UPI00194F291F|nr:hypothetical protein [Sphaerimonospora thailandensis]